MRTQQQPDTLPDVVQFEDFYALAPENKFIYADNGSLWPAATVDARLPAVGGIKPSKRLHIQRPVEDMSWSPGEPRIIRHKLPIEAGWIDKPGATVFNLYRAPRRHLGDPAKAEPWLDHVHMVYPDEADHIVKWCACRVQYPEIKINHCLVLGGEPGIGKDTLLCPVIHAVGSWNVAIISPVEVLGRFSRFKRNVLIILSEARDLGDAKRPALYDHIKDLMAAPPPMLRVDEKNRQEYYIANLCGVVVTTNYKVGGLYIPENDRRYYVAWSPLPAKTPGPDYFITLYGWFENGGLDHVAAYLETLDLGGFDPKAAPPMTQAFWEIAAASKPPQIGDLADAIEKIGEPDLFILPDLIAVDATAAALLTELANRTQIPRWLDAAGYIPVPNLNAKNRKWSVYVSGPTDRRKLIVYGKKTIHINELIRLARAKYD